MSTERQEIGLMLRQRADELREGRVGYDGLPVYEINQRCERELIALAIRIEAGENAEAPLAESVWHHEMNSLHQRIRELEEERERLRGLLQGGVWLAEGEPEISWEIWREQARAHLSPEEQTDP